jgi:hypothetical protein
MKNKLFFYFKNFIKNVIFYKNLQLYNMIVICIGLLYKQFQFLFPLFFLITIIYSDGEFINTNSNGDNNPEVIIILIVIYCIFKIYKIYYTFVIPPLEKDDFYFKSNPNIDLNDEEPQGILKIIDTIKQFIDICNNHPYILIYVWLASVFTFIFIYKFVYLKYYKKK